MSEERTGGSYAGTTTYEYDTLGQLTRVNDPKDTRGGSTGTTWVYTYDRGGNILSKKRYAYTTGALGTPQLTIPYAYGDANWKDKLTSFNGVAFEYDEIGNLTNDGAQAYEWTDGRKLAHTNNETTGMDVTYEYDHNGMRIRKSAGQHITNYTLRGDKIAYLTWGIEPNDKMRFEYDGQGRPAIVNFNGADYHYLYNLQGDVVGLIDNTGTLVVEYNYDAWGRIIGRTGSLVGTLGWLNPFRYRGYVYDEETGMYYLKSRYYNPEWGRFISCDGYLWEKNLYSYCLNSPIKRIDTEGNISCTCAGDLSNDPGNNIIDDDMALGGGYHVDLSIASNSSLLHSPLLDGEWSGYYIQTPRTYSNDRSGSFATPEMLNNYATKVATQYIADNPGRGSTYGVKVHAYVEGMINQKGWYNVRTEASYKNQQIVNYGVKGSVRLDAAIVDASGFPTYAIDIKTGSATLTQKRVNQINSHLKRAICIDQVP